jgi:DNA modification methylase
MAESQAEFRDRIKEFRRVRAGDLKPSPRNWRTHPKNQRDALVAVLEDVGIADAVIAREVNGHLELIDGHLRADLNSDVQLPVLVLDVTEEEADTILATLDPLAAMAGADTETLSKLVDGMRGGGLDDLCNQLTSQYTLTDPANELADVPAEVDRAEELREKWGVELGQLWSIEGKEKHRLVCGDSTDEQCVDEVLGKQTPFIMVTDPPYGVEYDPNWRNEAAEAGHLAYAARRIGKVDNDDRIDWSEAYKLFPGDVAYTWSPPGDHVILTGQALQGAGFGIRNQIIWVKPHFPISRGAYTYQHEPCWYGVRKGRKAKWVGDNNESTAWRIPLDKNVDGGHSTQKPLECMARPIRNHGDKDDHVYDPFLGSGTTMVAAEQLGRRCFGIDISPGYVAVTLERMTKLGCTCKTIA